MIPLLPFAAGVLAGVFAVRIAKQGSAQASLGKARTRLREATVSGLAAIEHSSAQWRTRLEGEAAEGAPAAADATATETGAPAASTAAPPAAKKKAATPATGKTPRRKPAKSATESTAAGTRAAAKTGAKPKGRA